MLGRMEAQALLQTLTMSFPALKAIHTREKCVHRSAGRFTTGRVPSTWGCQIISALPHPSPETQPAYSFSSSHLISTHRASLTFHPHHLYTMSYLSQPAKPLLSCALLFPLSPSPYPVCSCLLPKHQTEGVAVDTQKPVEVLSQIMERSSEM